MRGRRFTVAVVVALLLVSAGVCYIESVTNVRRNSLAFAVLGLTVTWSFVIAGLVAWRRRPGNRTGLLMIAIGFSWAGAALSDSPDDLVFTLGLLVGDVWPGLLVHLLLAYPSGRLDRRSRFLVAVAYFITVGLSIVTLPFTEPREEPGGASRFSAHNVALADHLPGLVSAVTVVAIVIAVPLIIAVLWTVLQRWRHASPATRRVLAPLYLTGAVAMGAILVFTSVLDVLNLASGDTGFYVFAISFTAIPVGYLLGILRTRLDRSTAVETLVAQIGGQSTPGGLRDALRVALNDDTLDVAYRRAGTDHYVDAAGEPYVFPTGDDDRAVTTVEHGDEVVAALVHDPVLLDDPDLIDAVCGPAALSIENERLQAELRAQFQEVAASRARIVAAGDAERRRLERNLHDGAQQRLVSLALSLHMARSAVSDGSEAAALLEAASAELSEALAELRELARGIHPAILTDQGLRSAVGGLVARTPVPVTVSFELDRELAQPVEAAIYYVVAEALTNVAKYAGATAAAVKVASAGGLVRVEVTDDGMGGADPARGSGLRGLSDRIEALGGRLRFESPPGDGTRVWAELPIAPRRGSPVPGTVESTA